MYQANSSVIDVGQDLGRYRIEGLLGAGGMGVVYLAEDRELRRRVAIKVADPTRGHVEAPGSLLQEARIAAALNHPAICSVHEVGHAGGKPFIVMELVEGTLLSSIISQTRGLGLERALDYVLQIADAVAHAHAHGIVHGDLKSSNVVISSDGRVKILDFGLAVPSAPLVVEETTRPQTPPSTAGTLPYMAPELLRGGPASAGTDIWALGVLLMEMLTGARPFPGATPYEIAAAILRDEPLPVPDRLPRALRAIVSRCLAKGPADRFRSVTELASALDDLGSESGGLL